MNNCKAVFLMCLFALGVFLSVAPTTVNFNEMATLYGGLSVSFILVAALTCGSPFIARITVVGTLLGFLPICGGVPHYVLTVLLTFLLGGILLVESECKKMDISHNLCQLEGGEHV